MPGVLINNDQGVDWNADYDFTEDDWLEAIAMYSPASFGMGRKRSSASLTGFIPFARLPGAVRYFLGASWVSDEPGFPVLHRDVPATHPWFPTMFATEISDAVGVKFISKVARPHKWSLPYANYTLCRVTVNYSQLPFPVLADGDIDMSSLEAYRGQEMR